MGRDWRVRRCFHWERDLQRSHMAVRHVLNSQAHSRAIHWDINLLMQTHAAQHDVAHRLGLKVGNRLADLTCARPAIVVKTSDHEIENALIRSFGGLVEAQISRSDGILHCVTLHFYRSGFPLFSLSRLSSWIFFNHSGFADWNNSRTKN